MEGSGREGAKLIKSVWKLPPPPSVKLPAFLRLHSSEGSFQGGIREEKFCAEGKWCRNGGGAAEAMATACAVKLVPLVAFKKGEAV